MGEADEKFFFGEGAIKHGTGKLFVLARAESDGGQSSRHRYGLESHSFVRWDKNNLCFGATYLPQLSASPKKNCSICFSHDFCELGSSGFNGTRYDHLGVQAQSFHASFNAFVDALPSSPCQGTRSSPGSSFPNFTQCTMRAPVSPLRWCWCWTARFIRHAFSSRVLFHLTLRNLAEIPSCVLPFESLGRRQ